MDRVLRFVPFFLAVVCFLVSIPAFAATDEQIKEEIIQNSLSQYSGGCPCPYSINKAGRTCGKRSAYSRPNGEKPICYPKDVTKSMLELYKGY
ncbi:MAG: hypothetical protein K0R63_1424 [Rickettsiales bacterium]|jgi:hypothetical protein|nr:hypothetical protein [Rickettsiales bacterium]